MSFTGGKGVSFFLRLVHNLVQLTRKLSVSVKKNTMFWDNLLRKICTSFGYLLSHKVQGTHLSFSRKSAYLFFWAKKKKKTKKKS